MTHTLWTINLDQGTSRKMRRGVMYLTCKTELRPGESNHRSTPQWLAIACQSTQCTSMERLFWIRLLWTLYFMIWTLVNCQWTQKSWSSARAHHRRVLPWRSGCARTQTSCDLAVLFSRSWSMQMSRMKSSVVQHIAHRLYVGKTIRAVWYSTLHTDCM